jgi:hypothetical protein
MSLRNLGLKHGGYMITCSNNYKQRLLDEIQGLSESELSKILKLVHFLKKEVLETEEREEDLKLFWDSFGSWKDDRTPEEIIQEIYKSRKSSIREIQL